MENSGFTLRWEDDPRGHTVETVSEDVICSIDGTVRQFSGIEGNSSHLTNESIIADTDQMAAENLIFLAQDIVGQIGNYTEGQYRSDGYDLEQCDPERGDEIECQVTEEIITDDWVQPGGPEQVEVPLEQLVMVSAEPSNEESAIDVPLPTDQDEYTAMRPYPCDFCSRRFRKKANLMNHMVAHRSDRTFCCNLCGDRYAHRSDFLNHLKIHATMPADGEDVYGNYEPPVEESPPRRRNRRRSPHSVKDDYSFANEIETSVAARTQQYGGNSASTSLRNNMVRFEATDPSRPFVCQHCGIGFAREKALQSHSRVHGGDSPIECGICGEMCWSKEQLTNHTKTKHPHRTPQAASQFDEDLSDFSSGSSFDEDFADTPINDSQPVGPELICKDCGVGFQREDLLRRHVRAAHSHRYKIETEHKDLFTDRDIDGWNENEHSCGVCGERFREPLDLLAHAGTHAGQRGSSSKRLSSQKDRSVDCNVCGERFPNKMALISHRHVHSANSKQFPCRECGKNFGSRSSQQIHERIHTGERPYSCRFCWKAFADGGTLRKHERIHTGEKPYACAVCPRAFNQRVVLREHVRSHHSGPDSRRGTSSTPFWCPVCGQLFAASVDLIHHIIGHCDANTALKRQPQVGPRKYKRRRKTTSYDQDDDKVFDDRNPSDLSDQDEFMNEDLLISKKKPSTSSYKRSRKSKSSLSTDEEELESLRAELDNSSKVFESTSGSARTKGKSKAKSFDMPRPKMIHTQKTKIADTATPGKRKKKATHIVTTTIVASTSSSGMRTRTREVKSEGRILRNTLSGLIKPEPEVEAEPEAEADIAADLRAILHPPEQMEEELEEEILNEICVEEESTNIKKEPSGHNDFGENSGIKVKREKDDSTFSFKNSSATADKETSENSQFRCEMCSESFSVREELLLHVPIHIT